MQHAARVRVRERLGGAERQRERLGDRQRPALGPCGHGLAVDELIRDPELAVGLADVVDGGDVRVVELGGGARFALEALARGLRLPPGGGQELQSDGALERGVDGAPHAAIAALAEQGGDLIAPERPTDHEETPDAGWVDTSAPPGTELDPREITPAKVL